MSEYAPAAASKKHKSPSHHGGVRAVCKVGTRPTSFGRIREIVTHCSPNSNVESHKNLRVIPCTSPEGQKGRRLPHAGARPRRAHRPGGYGRRPTRIAVISCTVSFPMVGWLGLVRFGSFRFRVRLRPVPELNGSVRFGSAGSVRFGFLFFPVRRDNWGSLLSCGVRGVDEADARPHRILASKKSSGVASLASRDPSKRIWLRYLFGQTLSNSWPSQTFPHRKCGSSLLKGTFYNPLNPEVLSSLNRRRLSSQADVGRTLGLRDSSLLVFDYMVILILLYQYYVIMMFMLFC